MLEKQSFSDQRIIDCLSAYYGIEVVTLTFLPLGADISASVYKADARNQSSYFIKLKHGHHYDISIAVVELLHGAGVQEIILPVKTIDGQSIQRIDDFNLIVYPFIEGQNGFSCALTNEQWLVLGKALRQIHEVEVPFAMRHQLRQETYSTKWRDLIRSFYDHIEAKPVGDKVALKLLAFMKENLATIKRLVNRAEQLAQELRSDSSQLMLCHADIHGGNVLITENGAIYIIDWDEPMMAPKERDFMFIGGGVGNVWNKSCEETLFYKGYGETEIKGEILAYYRHERIVEDIAQFVQQLLLTTAGGANRAEMYQHFIDMFAPRGVVDIAFETDGR